MILKTTKYHLLLFAFFLGLQIYEAQYYQHLKLSDALYKGLRNNAHIQQERIRNKIAETISEAKKDEKLPDIDLHTNYSRLTNIRQYENGITNSTTRYNTISQMYDFTLSASIPVYSGGLLKNNEKKSIIDREISSLKTHLSERELKMKIITAYLQILHLQEQNHLMENKMKEDSANIRQTQILKNNGVVTSNEVLRTQLQLSNHRMMAIELQNNIAVEEDLLRTLLSVPENQELHADTENLVSESFYIPELEQLTRQAADTNEEMEILQKKEDINLIERKIIRSEILPKISAGAEYFLKYPNMLFFPPEPNLYRMGMAGITLTYPVGNLLRYKNRKEQNNQEMKLAKLQQQEKKEGLRHEVYTAYKQFEEAGQKIGVAREAITEAEENYRIVKIKYTNKLSLITELIDADNAYLEAQSQLISAKINQQLKYYQLQFVTGNL